MSDANGTCEYVLDPDDPETWGGDEGDECYVEEKVLNEDGVWTCPHDAEDGEDLCIFHLPIKEKDDEEVSDIFVDILDREYKNNHMFIGSKLNLILNNFKLSGNSISSINLKHSRFGVIKMENTNISRSIELQGSTCSDAFILSNTTFDCSLNLSNMVFGEGIRHMIASSNFNSYVTFSEADINNKIVIENTKFSDRVNLNNANFNGDVEINDTEFKNGADFWWTTFDSTTIISDTIFGFLTVFNTNFNAMTKFVNVEFENVTFEIETAITDNSDLTRKFWQTYRDTDTLPEDKSFRSLNRETPGESPFFVDLKQKHKTTFNNISFDSTVFDGIANFKFVEFSGNTSFNDCSFNNDVEFREAVSSDGVSIKNTSFSGEITFRQVKFPGSVLSDIDLSGSDLRDAKLSESELKKSDLTDSDLSGAEIQDGNLERALLNRADLFDTKLKGTAFYGAVFGDAQINEETEFGNRCVYDPEFADEPAADIQDDETGRLTKAAGQYRIIEQLARTNAFPDMVSHNFIRRQDIHREQHRQEGRRGRWLRATASKYVLEYGENPWRLIATGIITVVTFGLLYPLVGGLQPTGGSTITLSRTLDNPILLLQSIYYSTLTFTTLGMGDFLPVGLGRVLTTIETSLGAIIIALLVFVFGRRAAR